MRVCGKCKQEFPLTAEYWHKNRTTRLGFAHYCKSCNSSTTSEFQKLYPHLHNKNNINWRTKKKIQALEYYSKGTAKCACCGVHNLVFLTLDHINGGGSAHRKTIKSKSLTQWVVDNGFPEGFQVLCWNCNWAKSHGGCPHQEN